MHEFFKMTWTHSCMTSIIMNAECVGARALHSSVAATAAGQQLLSAWSCSWQSKGLLNPTTEPMPNKVLCMLQGVSICCRCLVAASDSQN